MVNTVQEINARRNFYRRRWVPLFIFILGVFVFLPSIWSETSATERDEFSLSFRTPMEMKERGEFLTPWLNREPRLRKPPLLYWATLVNYDVFGVTLASARIWGVLAGAGLAACSCLLAREIFRTNGLLAGLLALSSVGVAVEARQAMLDLPVAFFSVLAVLFWLRWQRLERWRDIICSAFALGGAFLVKGPVGLFFFLTGAVTALWGFQNWSILRRRPLQLLVWFVLLLAICLPWPLWMRHVWGERFTQTVEREATARHFIDWNSIRLVSTFSGLLGLIFPWTPLFIGAVGGYFMKMRYRSRRSQTWLLVWCLATAVPFFLMKASERYLLAVAPVECVMIASWLQDGESLARRWLCRASVTLLALVALGLCGAVLWFKLGIISPLLCLASICWTLWQALRTKSNHRMALGAVVTMSLCLGLVYPQLGVNAMPPDLKEKVAGLPAAQFDGIHPALVSMRLGYSVQRFDAKTFPGELALHPNGIALFLTKFEFEEFNGMLATNRMQSEELFHFGTMAAVKTYFSDSNKFDRESRREALVKRSIEPIQIQVYCYRVTPEPEPVQN